MPTELPSDHKDREVLTPDILPKDGEMMVRSASVSERCQSMMRGIHDRIAGFFDRFRPYRGNEVITFHPQGEDVSEDDVVGLPHHFGKIVREIYEDFDEEQPKNNDGHQLKIYEE